MIVCTTGEIRLRDGATSFEGRVEICYNNAWGTICNNSWSTNNVNVACRQLGFRSTGNFFFMTCTVCCDIYFVKVSTSFLHMERGSEDIWPLDCGMLECSHMTL